MKRILIIALISVLSGSTLYAQKTCCKNSENDTSKSCTKTSDKDEYLPITRDQAEELITKMVVAARAPYVKERMASKKLMQFKIETLKRRLLDQALRDTYVDEYKDRMDRLERMMMMLIISNSKGKISPDMIYSMMGNNGTPSINNTTTTVPMQQPCEKSTTNCPKTTPSLQSNLTNTNGNEVVEGQITASFLSQVFFKVSKSNLSTESKQVLDGVVAWMKENAAVKVSLKGYASPDGPLKFNNKLSKRRVDAVADYLTSRGVDRNRLEIEPSGIDSMTNTLPEARRVDIKPILCD